MALKNSPKPGLQGKWYKKKIQYRQEKVVSGCCQAYPEYLVHEFYTTKILDN